MLLVQNVSLIVCFGKMCGAFIINIYMVLTPVKQGYKKNLYYTGIGFESTCFTVPCYHMNCKSNCAYREEDVVIRSTFPARFEPCMCGANWAGDADQVTVELAISSEIA